VTGSCEARWRARTAGTASGSSRSVRASPGCDVSSWATNSRVTPWLFQTERLAVRPKTADDVDALHVVYGDADVMRFSGGRFTTLERTRSFVTSHIGHQETHGFSMWALVERGSGTLVGDVGFLAYEDGVEIGWHLRRSAWGQGYATEAARACLAHGFDRFDFPRVSAFTESGNAASLRVIEKLGMRFVRGGASGVPAWVEYVAARPVGPEDLGTPM
jgi:ribosomal-protein-alanine N-acetyltransferase